MLIVLIKNFISKLNFKTFWLSSNLSIGIIFVAFLLTSCSFFNQPSNTVLVQALSLEIQLTQQKVSSSINTVEIVEPKVKNVKIESRRKILIGDHNGTNLTGKFDWQLSDDSQIVNSHFQLFLEEGEKSESWRLAKFVDLPGSPTKQWISYPIFIDYPV